MKAQNFLPTKQQNKQIRHVVIKGSQNIPYDANVMAQIQQQKSYQQQLTKKNRMQSFLNSTKLNASKIYKQKSDKNNQKINSKKILLEKQKDLKSKYTIVKRTDNGKIQNQHKKGQALKNIKIEPRKVQWKKAEESNVNKINIPQQKLVYENDSDEEDMSAIDSDVDLQKQSNPKDMLRLRQNLRNSMLNKFNRKK